MCIRDRCMLEPLAGAAVLHAPQVRQFDLHLVDGQLRNLQGLVRAPDLVASNAALSGEVRERHGHDFAGRDHVSQRDLSRQPIAGLSYTAMRGCHVRSGWRQSIPSSSIESCAALSETLPLSACGQTKRPRSSRFVSMHMPSPSLHSNFTRSPLRPRNAKTWPLNGSCVNVIWTFAASESMPQRMSVTPAASHTRVPARGPIMRCGAVRARHFPAGARRRPVSYTHLTLPTS